MSKTTSWGSVSEWYSDYLEGNKDSYQAKVVLPNLMRILALEKSEKVLDLACGQGFFSREFFKTGASVHGVDISSELIQIARKLSPKEISYTVSSADQLAVIADKSINVITIILAIQNIENVKTLLAECRRVLSDNGRVCVVMNHPAYRVLRGSSWGYDDNAQIQYRRVDKYLSESKETIDMNPGAATAAEKVKTISFHRPLQYYFKLLHNGGFVASRLEEWISHKESEKGTRKNAEDVARREIPLFLFLEAKKN